MPLEPTRQLRFIYPSELPYVIGAHEGWHHRLPPPGCRVVYREPVGAMGVLPDIVGTPEDGSAGDRWWASLGDIAFGNGADLIEVAGRLAGLIAPEVRAVFAVTDVPLVYEQGGETVRWIASTFRGTIGIEQFQFGINWGNPGNDPDPNEAETLAFAQTLATQWSAAWIGTYGSSAFKSYFPADVVFEEVGAVVKEQTSATAADGSGGDLSQKFDTQWSAYAVGSKPTGGGGATPSLPFEVSCAVTLQTDKRGPSGRGRIYLPPCHVGTMINGGKYDSGATSTFGKGVGSFFQQIESATGHVPVVVSRRRLILNEVTSINVGVIPDAQRRRRRSMDEARVTQWTKP